MDLLSLILYLFLTITLLQVFHSLRQSKRRSKLPPGPGPLPVVGNLLKLGGKPHKSLAELAKTHGPIMSLKLGQITTVVISSSSIAKEVLQKQDLAFSTRFIPNAVHAHDHYKYSVPFLPVSDRWRNLRKILNSNIFSGSRLDGNQNLRQQKVEELIAYAGKCCRDGVAVDIGSAALATSLNLLSNTMFSVDLANLSNDSGREFRDLTWNIMMEVGKPNLVDYFPLLAKIDPQGTDTTSSTIEWAMAELLRNPENLKKAKAELEQTIGKGKLIQESDISQLPYLQGIVKETMRIHPSLPFLLPRKVEADVEVHGYTVPKGAQVLVNAWAIGKDPSIWKNPTTFKPERFLESKVDVRGQDFELIPFGAGRRICPGLPLAIRMIPVVLGSLLNSFDWKIEGGIEPEELDMEDKFGLTLQKAQPLRAIPFHM